MQKEDLFYLEHIRECITRIQQYTYYFSEDDFVNNTLVQDAVIRNFEIIGEATKKLSSPFKDKYSYIEWRRIAEMRDKLIHDYIGVDIRAVWAVVADILPELRKQIDQIIEQEK